MGKRDKILFALGFLAVVMLMIPGMILGENAVITYHDQLDGEMIAYILQAKHLLDNGILPEFMDGASKTALMPPAPACVLLFLSGHYLAALWLMQIAGCIVGYVGMYLLAADVTGKKIPAVLAGVLYASIPFLPVYGLSQYGIPMLLWCVLRLRRGEGIIISYVYAAVLALNSSLVLAGFAMLLTLAAVMVSDIVRYGVKDGMTKVRYPAGMWVIMLVGYVLTNFTLITQIMGMGDMSVSHKAEYALVPENLGNGWLTGLLYGGQHSQDYHLSFILAAVLTIVSFTACSAYWKKNFKQSISETGLRNIRIMYLIFICNLCLSGAAALWNSETGVRIRTNMGAAGAFQMDRLLWLCPCLWYMMLACNLAVIIELWNAAKECNGSGERKYAGAFVGVCAGICCALTVGATCVSGFNILKNSDFKSNVRKLIESEYPAMSYGDYYAIGVMEQVEEFIRETKELEQSEYRVVSLGIDPAAALYHGFYCLDGYSNNYSLEYKHSFRNIIAPALEVSDYLRDYYDNWGNRCYVFGSECPGYYTIEKNGFYFSHLEMDAEALRNMGGDYLLSAAYIANAQDLGLTLLRDEPFQTEDSYYRIFIYEVN